MSVIEDFCDKVYDHHVVPVVNTTKVGLVRNALSLLHKAEN